jgi:hypothetical protein
VAVTALAIEDKGWIILSAPSALMNSCLNTSIRNYILKKSKAKGAKKALGSFPNFELPMLTKSDDRIVRKIFGLKHLSP